MFDRPIDTNLLPEIAKSNPKFATILGSIAGIDKEIKHMLANIINEKDSNRNCDNFYIKTQVTSTEYIILIFDALQSRLYGRKYLMEHLIQICSTKLIEPDLHDLIQKLLHYTYNLNDVNKVIWL